MKKLTEKELIELMAEFVEKRYEKTQSAMLLKGKNREYAIVPNNRNSYTKTE